MSITNSNRIGPMLPRLGLLLIASALATLALAGPATADEFGLIPGSFSAEISTQQAGAHPDFRTKFSLEQNPDASPKGGGLKSFQAKLPKGLIGNPNAIPTCPIGTVVSRGSPCPRNAMVGVLNVIIRFGSNVRFSLRSAVFNVNPYPGEPAAFATLAFPGVPFRLDTFIRPDGDYGVTATADNLSQAQPLLVSDLTLWGVPADHSGSGPEVTSYQSTIGGPNPGAARIPFLTNPTECSGSPLDFSMDFQSWLHPDLTVPATTTFGAITGCDQLDFEPSIDVLPTTNLTDTPTGLQFGLHLGQHEKFTGANELQALSVHATEGQYRLSIGGQSTPDLPFNAIPEQVQEALEALPAVGSGNVAAFGGPHYNLEINVVENDPIAILFQGALANTDVAQIEVKEGTEPLQLNENGISSQGSAVVSTSVTGHLPASVSEESATSHLRDAVVTLPAGMTVNASSANGLQSCSLAQIGMTTDGEPEGSPVACPDASKIGTVEAISPAIGHTLPGALYLAAQKENPFDTLLALYLVVDDPLSGVVVKVPGEVKANPEDGQLTVSFKNSPQLPIEDINLNLFKGDTAALKTPAACGTYTTTSVFTPWSAGAEANPTSSFALTNGPDGGACLPDGPAALNNPGFSAGTVNPAAKAFTPFNLTLTRADGSQPFKAISATLPKGLLAKLAGVPYCSEAALAAAANTSGRSEQASPSCPAASQVGTVNVGAGAGSKPFYASGKVYLAGPYKRAPLSLAVITPAVAGPFDLGTVVIRNVLKVDPVTTQTTAISDPIPTILQGIPLDIRSVALSIDRPDFTFNPTNCDPSAVLGSATSVFSQSVAFTEPFQVGDCAKLGFKPTLKLALKGAVHRRAHPSLRADLTARPGDANIASAQVKLPKAAFLDNDHIGEICTRVQFAAHTCPAGSIYGKAEATSPLVDYTLSGPVYLRSSSHKLPDLVAAFQGPATQPIEVELAGTTDSVKGALRNTFEAVPDVPVSTFHLELFGGKKGLIEMSSGFCAHPNASVSFTAQNANSYASTPKVSAKCGKSGKNARGRGHGRRAGQR